MPLKVLATLTRPSATYLAGETLECDITVECSDYDETIAWASAQVNCQEIVEPNLMHKRKRKSSLAHTLSQNDVTSGSTSFVATMGERGDAIYSSLTEIICCNLQIKDGETKHFTYRSCLPMGNAPPSFKGVCVKYGYKLTIGIQTVNRAVKLLKVPFRVLAITGCTSWNIVAAAEESRGVDRANRVASALESANRVIDLATCQESPKKFNVALDKGQEVCVISMSKKCFRLGEDICVSFSFDPDSPMLCTESIAMLQTVEEICTDAKETGGRIDSVEKLESTVSEQREYCAFYKQCQIKLHIPVSATPSFFTDFVNMKWRLRFEFHVTPRADETLPQCMERWPDGSLIWTAPKRVNVRRLIWDLPIKVFPCNPNHAVGFSLEPRTANSFCLTL